MVAPKLRFHVEKSIFEKTYLQKITDVIGDGIHATPTYLDNGDCFFINGNNLKNGSIVITENTKKISSQEKSKYRDSLNERSILLSINGTIGNLAYYNNEPILLGKSAAYINVSTLYSKRWIYYILQSNSVLRYFEKELTGTTIKNLSLKTIRDTVIYSPNLEEQTKIANFLSAVDERIQQVSQTHELLTQYKKGVMQKIFNQELRFKDENGQEFGEWEVKALGDIASFLKGKGLSKSDIVSTGLYPCIRYGELYTQYAEKIDTIISKTNIDKDSCVLSKHNDVIIPSSGESNIEIAKASCILQDDVILGGDLNIIRTSENGLFLSYYLNYQKKLEIAQLAQGNSVVHLYGSQLKNLILSLPTLPEQTKIANFLSAIDDKINQAQSQLTALQEYKRGLLQQMFV
ncbi:Restriction modification system DNA specificity domain protein [Enterobacterales bacterium 8AC]|nr:Restriction modification system DNA specificity domain protein [Enterobacterales bacterium 8AC]